MVVPMRATENDVLVREYSSPHNNPKQRVCGADHGRERVGDSVGGKREREQGEDER